MKVLRFIWGLIVAFWKELVLAYKTAKSFVVQALGVFKTPPMLNDAGTVIHAGKVSAKRVWGSVAFAIAVRQILLPHADLWGALIAAGIGTVLLVIAALTGT